MNKMEKDRIYDEMCRTLTDYEHEPMSAENAVNDFYDILVKIQNNWEELVSEEDDYLETVGHYLFPFYNFPPKFPSGFSRQFSR